MHTAEVLFKFFKFLPLWLFTANKACEISEKPALKKPDGQPSQKPLFDTLQCIANVDNEVNILGAM